VDDDEKVTLDMTSFVCLPVAGDVIDRAIQVAKPYTAIRLVSSGWSYNSVTFRYQKLTIADYDD